MATKWNSVWAEPLLNRIQGQLNAGEKLSDSDVAAWKTWAESRKYEATQPDLMKMDAKEIEVTAQNASQLVLELNRKQAE